MQTGLLFRDQEAAGLVNPAPYLPGAQSLSCRLAPGWTCVHISLGRLTPSVLSEALWPQPQEAEWGRASRSYLGPTGGCQQPSGLQHLTGMLARASITLPTLGRNVAWATGSQEPGRRGGKRLPPPSGIPQAWHQITWPASPHPHHRMSPGSPLPQAAGH